MCLIDHIIEWDMKHIICQTSSHLVPDHPLRSNGQLSSIHAAEYGAQAMALHGGLLAHQDGKCMRGGYLVSLRGVKLLTPRLDTLKSFMVITANQLLANEGNMLYDFSLRAETGVIAKGRAAVIVNSEEIP
jgi:predicted hotdog family 3-hydroxylacyl-ACP dehydratase